MSAIKEKYLCAWSSARTQLQISFEKCSLRDEPSLKKSMTREICVGAYNRLEIVLPQKLKVAAGRSRTVTPHRAAFRVLLISHEHRTCTWGKTCARPIHHLGRWEKKKKNDVRGSDTVTRLVTPVRRAVSPRRFSPPLRREREREREPRRALMHFFFMCRSPAVCSLLFFVLLITRDDDAALVSPSSRIVRTFLCRLRVYFIYCASSSCVPLFSSSSFPRVLSSLCLDRIMFPETNRFFRHWNTSSFIIVALLYIVYLLCKLVKVAR